jgi:thiamine-phosphate pyrophosphorylase
LLDENPAKKLFCDKENPIPLCETVSGETLLVSAAIGFDRRTTSGDILVPADTKLYLDFEAAGTPETAREVLAAVLDAAPVATVLIRPRRDTVLDTAMARAMIAIAKKRSIPALILANSTQAAQIEADGIHLPWAPDIVSQFKETRRVAPPGLVIGADAGRSRHDAMELGEAGADYIAFGVPSDVEDRALAVERQIDLIAWWNEIFELPSVAFDVADAEAARRLAEAGADFVSVTIPHHFGVGDAVSRVRAFADALTLSERAE